MAEGGGEQWRVGVVLLSIVIYIKTFFIAVFKKKANYSNFPVNIYGNFRTETANPEPVYISRYDICC